MRPLILASASPRRISVLSELNVDFVHVSSDIEEAIDPRLPPEQVVTANAYRKANEAASGLSTGLVIGADTIVFFQGKIIGKPSDLSEARRTLKTLSGNRHSVYTGLSVVDVDEGRHLEDFAVTEVTFRRFEDSDIDRYLRLVGPLDKAGAYAAQGLGGIILDKVNGCFYNVVGLPVAKLDEMLRHFGVSLLAYAKPAP